MTRYNEGDRVRVDLFNHAEKVASAENLHGTYCTVTTNTDDDGYVTVESDDGDISDVPEEALRPTLPLSPVLGERERETASNIWGDVPQSLRDVSTDKLWEMKERVSDAIELSYEDDDMASMGVLCPLGVKITHVLSERSQR